MLNSATGDDLVQTVHITDQQYLVALMIFIVAYTLFETPSNYMLKRFRPSRWYVRYLSDFSACALLNEILF